MISIVGAQEQVDHATSSGDSDDEEVDQVLQAERRKRKNENGNGESRTGRPKFGGSR